MTDYMDRNIIIVDIDGTVALRGDRGPYDWHRVHEDERNHPVALALLAMRGMWDSEVHFFTGRMEQCRDATAQWLEEALGWWTTSCSLCMRADDDYRPDDVVKAEMFEQSGIDPNRVLFVLDDRKRVVDMWRKQFNLTVFQVAEGDF